ncbi:type II toxin-antitoxin system RelE/ParE family toxin [Bittarella massiliensis (ex Durand et al. 2017)]|uniref:type II toxin-antitoxin system RelE/ParE family toxin n=1 Tax=Bittarella massiliensis (ex Durand et al. 2017) TaxID=1720313 RepID=UPI000AEA6A97|nr:type II toxin-antitoxin system RelE/ParE family toxin [Bittarella massiliensis (ex Durand et al. 2017)]
MGAYVRSMENDIYKIRYTPLAFEDLDSIDTYISKTLYNEAAAIRLLDQMEQSISRLEQYPYTGPEVEDVYLASKGYRKLVVENYLIFYLVNKLEKEVFIMRVLFGAREYHNFL